MCSTRRADSKVRSFASNCLDVQLITVSIALTGSTDFGEIIKRAFPESNSSAQNDEQAVAALTYNLYLDRLLGFLSSYISALLASPAPLNKLHGLIFSGGIGEHSAKIRQDVVETFAWIEKLARSEGGLDTEANGQSQGLRRITREGSIVPAFVVETDEELEAVELAIQAAE